MKTRGKYYNTNINPVEYPKKKLNGPRYRKKDFIVCCTGQNYS